MKKYLVIGSYVISVRDGQQHYVSAHRLVELYKVPISECVLVDQRLSRTTVHLQSVYASYKHLLILRPRYEGDYHIDPNEPDRHV